MELMMPLDSILPPTETMPDLEDYVTTQEAADELDLHIETVRMFLRYKKLEGLKIGRTWLVARESIKAYREQTTGKEKHDPTRSQE
jgi:excisionase family DNA binding protein